jgi:hypothetical protein
MATLNLRGDFLRPTNNTNPGLNQMDNFPNRSQETMDMVNNFQQFDPYANLSSFQKSNPYINAPAVADGMRNQNPFINTQKQSFGFPNGQSSGFRNGQWIDNSNAGAIQSAKDRVEYEIKTFGKASAAALKAYEDANGDNDGISGEQTRYMNKRGVPSAAQWSSHVGELTDRLAEERWGKAGRQIAPTVTTAEDVRKAALRDSMRDFDIMGRPDKSTYVPSYQEKLEAYENDRANNARADYNEEAAANIRLSTANIGYAQAKMNGRTQPPTYQSQNPNPYMSGFFQVPNLTK